MLYSLVQNELSHNLLLKKNWFSIGYTFDDGAFIIWRKKLYCKQQNMEKIWHLKEYDA